MRTLFVLMLVAAVHGDGADRWDISQAVATVSYGDARIAVWHDAHSNRYHMMPLAILLNDSVSVHQNILANKTELNFGVLMWSAESQELVHRYLVANVNSSIRQNQINPLAIERLRLDWEQSYQPLTSDYHLVSNWRANSHLPSVVYFKIACSNAPSCTTLKNALKNDLTTLDGLEMQYFVSGTKRRHVRVTGRHLSAGTVYNKLTAMPAQSDVKFVTSQDVDVIASQTVQAALAESVPDYVDTGEVEIFTNALRRKLKLQPVSSTTLQAGNWDQVHWTPDSSRPDRLARYLNAALRIDPNDTQNFILDDSPLPEFRACQQVIAPMIGNGTKSSNAIRKIARATVLNAVKDKVEYDGGHFIAKPITLYRINLSSLNASTNLVWSNVRIQSHGSVQRAKVRVRSQKQPSRLTLELVQARLQADMNVVRADQRILQLETRQEMNASVVAHQKIMNRSVVAHERMQQMNRSVAEAHQEMKEMIRNLKTRMRSEFASLTDTRLTLLGTQFNHWPEYCRVEDHYCNVAGRYATYHLSTFSECDQKCDNNPRCQSFTYRASTTECLPHHYVCPGSKFVSNSAYDYYVKLSRVPIMTAQMWASLMVNGTVGDVPSDPCNMIGEKFTFTRYP